jgi:dethiobiotin synthetase
MKNKYNQFFITGTDTGVGKTTLSCYLLDYVNQQGRKGLGLKPIASGAVYDKHQKIWINDDGIALRTHSYHQFPYSLHNPIVFEEAIAPHLAAKKYGIELSVSLINKQLHSSLNSKADIQLIEGAGGWLLPLNKHETLADWVIYHGWPVILVVGMRLGCLNHSLLTHAHIKANNLYFAGWIANNIDPNMIYRDENLSSLVELFGEPPLMILDHGAKSPRQLNHARLNELFL